MEWYYAKHGKQEGPVDLATLQGMLTSGQVAPTDLVWKEGMAEWTPAGKVAELLPAPPASSPTPTPTPTPLAGPTPGGLAGPTPGATPGPAAGAQPAYRPPVAHQHVPNYLVPAILTTIFCCWAFGIPSIIFAAKVDGMVARGDIAGAVEASNNAKKWIWINVGVWGGLLALYIIFVVIAAMSGNM